MKFHFKPFTLSIAEPFNNDPKGHPLLQIYRFKQHKSKKFNYLRAYKINIGNRTEPSDDEIFYEACKMRFKNITVNQIVQFLFSKKRSFIKIWIYQFFFIEYFI